jgi:hypothetical protein
MTVLKFAPIGKAPPAPTLEVTPKDWSTLTSAPMFATNPPEPKAAG